MNRSETVMQYLCTKKCVKCIVPQLTGIVMYTVHCMSISKQFS